MRAHTSADARSPLFAETETFVTQEYERLRRTKIEPWIFLTAGPPFRCTDFYGKQISYQGVAFEGSPRDVFWGGFIEPFLRDLVVSVIGRTATVAVERGLAPRPPVLEAAGLLKGVVFSAYSRMQHIDQRLRGAGYPERAAPRPVDVYVDGMNSYLDQIVSGRLARKPLPGRLRRLGGQLIVGLVIAVVGGLILAAIR